MPRPSRSAWRPARPRKGSTGRMATIVTPLKQVHFELKGPELLQPVSARRVVGVAREIRESYHKQLRSLRRGL
jgi:hypothetical protein